MLIKLGDDQNLKEVDCVSLYSTKHQQREDRGNGSPIDTSQKLKTSTNLLIAKKNYENSGSSKSLKDSVLKGRGSSKFNHNNNKIESATSHLGSRKTFYKTKSEMTELFKSKASIGGERHGGKSSNVKCESANSKGNK